MTRMALDLAGGDNKTIEIAINKSPILSAIIFYLKCSLLFFFSFLFLHFLLRLVFRSFSFEFGAVVSVVVFMFCLVLFFMPMRPFSPSFAFWVLQVVAVYIYHFVFSFNDQYLS